MKTFTELRNKYSSIIYKDYKIIDRDNDIKIEYTFEIPNLITFNPSIEIDKSNITNKNISNKVLNNLVFHIGLVELISYYKCICPKEIILECGYLDEYQSNWFKKLYYNGLGEFLYRNNITISQEDLFNFINTKSKEEIEDINYKGHGNLIPVGGGKDSVVTLELLKDYDNKCFILNPKTPSLNCCNIAGYSSNDIIGIRRNLDRKIIDLNKEGYLNGHTPLSALIAFISYLTAYLSNREYIVLSNESSANEATVLNTNINHQYSKSYEFESDFQEYSNKYLKLNIKYFSLLRPIKEIQIAYLFSKLTKYHNSFKSCNLGSKEKEWVWCCNCPKCLFVFIILRAFLSKEQLINIFGQNLLDKKELEESFLELIGKKETKPFECVGTIDEVIYSLNRIIKDNDTSYLTNLYKDNYYEDKDISLTYLDNKHNVPKEYYDILKEALLNER